MEFVDGQGQSGNYAFLPCALEPVSSPLSVGQYLLNIQVRLCDENTQVLSVYMACAFTRVCMFKCVHTCNCVSINKYDCI